jgi:dipeptidyl aminopeptidase/acylaminoacyl peptidase
MQWAADGRILIVPDDSLRSVAVRRGKPKRVVIPSCQPVEPQGNPQCRPGGFILSPNREVAAITTGDSDPHIPLGIALVKVRARGDPVALKTPLGNGSVYDTVLTFSPSGSLLVFSQSSWDGWGKLGAPALMALPLGGGTAVPLAQSGIPGASMVPSDVEQVQWSPDSRWVAYVENDSTDGNQTLKVVPTTGAGTPRTLATCSTGSDFRFSWSPASRSIAYDCRAGSGQSSEFVDVRPDGTHPANLLKNRNLVYDQAGLGGPEWSPDGSRILFLAQGRFSTTDHIWTVRPDGSHLTRIR